MHINFSMGMDIYEASIEVYLGDKLIQKQSMKSPRIILEQQFMSLVEQVSNDERPIRIKMTVPDIIWDTFEQKTKTLNNYIEFYNKGDIKEDTL